MIRPEEIREIRAANRRAYEAELAAQQIKKVDAFIEKAEQAAIADFDGQFFEMRNLDMYIDKSFKELIDKRLIESGWEITSITSYFDYSIDEQRYSVKIRPAKQYPPEN